MKLCCFGTQALTWLEAHDALASWVQGIGGLLAVFAAAAIATIESKRAHAATSREEERSRALEEREQQRLRSLRSSALALVNLAMRRIQVAEQFIGKVAADKVPYWIGVHQGDIARMEAQLMSFPYYEMADAVAADAFVQARILVSAAEGYLRDAVASRHDDIMPATIAGVMGSTVEELAPIEAVIRERLDA